MVALEYLWPFIFPLATILTGYAIYKLATAIRKRK